MTVLVVAAGDGRYMSAALASVVDQTHRRLQILAVGAGGQGLREAAESFRDSRVEVIELAGAPSRACLFNEAIERVEGEYVAYLDDEAVYYHDHVATLVGLLSSGDDASAACSRFYTTHCQILPDDSRQVLAKTAGRSPHFDRGRHFRPHHAPIVSLMHLADLLDRTGPFAEIADRASECDMVRRLAEVAGFVDTDQITGERFISTDSSRNGQRAPAETDDQADLCERVLSTARMLEADGDSLRAAKLYERAADLGEDGLWTTFQAARALQAIGDRDSYAMELCQHINQHRPSVDSLLLEAKLHRSADRIERAVGLLDRARRTLQRRG